MSAKIFYGIKRNAFYGIKRNASCFTKVELCVCFVVGVRLLF